MKNRWCLALAFWLGLTPWGFSQSLNPGQMERTAQRLTHVLLERGFEVNRGSVKLWTADDCPFTAERIGYCMGNNPAAPYVIVAAPPWPDEGVIPQLRTIWGAGPPKYEDVFHLDPHEAIVLLVQMPPPARFFSEQSWVFSRQGTYDTTSDTYKRIMELTEKGVLPDFVPYLFFKQLSLPEGIPERILISSSLNNPINNVVIERQAKTAWWQKRYFIVTPDEYMNTALRSAFSELAVPDEAIFTDRIPSNLRVGLERDADDFLTWLRYAQPDDGGGPGTASAIWRKNLPIAVLRVRHTGHTPVAHPAFTDAKLEPRTAWNEYQLQPDLWSLVSAVSSKWGQPCTEANCSDKGATSFFDLQTDPVWMVGTKCEPIGENCLLDNWDASYQIYGRFPFDHGEIYAVAGTVGTRTTNATYAGLGVNKTSIFIGVANLTDSVLEGTASHYAQAVPGNKCPAVGNTKTTDCLFLYYFARDCSVVKNATGETNCFTIDEKLVPNGDSVTLSLRDYIRPGTQRGPDSTGVLPPIWIRVR